MKISVQVLLHETEYYLYHIWKDISTNIYTFYISHSKICALMWQTKAWNSVYFTCEIKDDNFNQLNIEFSTFFPTKIILMCLFHDVLNVLYFTLQNLNANSFLHEMWCSIFVLCENLGCDFLTLNTQFSICCILHLDIGFLKMQKTWFSLEKLSTSKNLSISSILSISLSYSYSQ